jgi:hypothetical protein
MECKVMDIFKSFSEILCDCYKSFNVKEYSGESRILLMNSVNETNAGVYILWKKGETYPFYIGCAGKIQKNGGREGRSVRDRLFSAKTPYNIDKEHLLYSPTTSGASPAEYNKKVALSELIVEIISVRADIAPAALEHLLLQGFLNEHQRLPEANQQL